jgi:outer membrane immunogenic protein
MRKFTIPIAIVAGLIAPAALAADIGGKAPLPAPAPAWSWTGWYAGVNAGASFGRAKTDFNVTPFTELGGIFTLGPGFAGSDTAFPSGFMGGGQVGYNWQWSPLIVLGVEADIQGALERETANFSNNFTCLPCTFGTAGTVLANYTTQIDWFGTVRARIGYVWGNGNVMSYITGGLAYGEVKIDGTNTVSGAVIRNPAATFSGTQAFGHSQVNTGWVAGYGTEGRLADTNWTWKIEGLYMGLGTLDATGVSRGASLTDIFCFSGGVQIPCNPNAGNITTHTRFTDGILRGGLNYKFY